MFALFAIGALFAHVVRKGRRDRKSEGHIGFRGARRRSPRRRRKKKKRGMFSRHAPLPRHVSVYRNNGRPALPPAPALIAHDELCSSWEIVDPERFNLQLQRSFDKKRLGARMDPFEMADTAFRDLVPPQCRFIEGRITNPGQLGLYDLVFRAALDRLRAEGTIDAATYRAFSDEFASWANSLGVAA